MSIFFVLAPGSRISSHNTDPDSGCQFNADTTAILQRTYSNDSVADPSRRQLKINFSKGKLFCLLLFEATFTSFLKDKKSKRKSQNGRNQGFSYYFYLMIEGSGSVPTSYSRIRIREAQKPLDPTDPGLDPLQCGKGQ